MGMMLPVERAGTRGPPLLLLHGFTGSRHAFNHLGLARHFRCVSVDLPGHADSPLPSVVDGFAGVVDAIAAALDGPSTVLGYSQGARLALALAVRHPGRVRSLVLVSGSPGIEDPNVREQRRIEDEALAARIIRDGVEAFASWWESRSLFADITALPAPLHAAVAAQRRMHRAEGLAGALRCMGTGVQPSFWGALAAVRVPFLLVTGAVDHKFTDIAARMRAALPVAAHAVIPGCGHAPHLTHPTELVQRIIHHQGEHHDVQVAEGP